MSAILLGAALAAAAAGSATARETPPSPGMPRAFALPTKQDLRLPNGLGVTLVPFGTVPKTTLALVLRTGNIADGPKTGLADLVADMLKEGAGDRDAGGLARLAAEMGGALGIDAGPDQTTVMLDVLAERAADAVGVLADVVRRPRLPASELPRLKANLARTSAIARSQPQEVAGEAYAHLIWGDHPYGRTLPTETTIASIAIEDIRQFVAHEFGAARAHLYVAGQFDAVSVERALNDRFGDWAPGSPPAAHPPVGSRTRTVKLIDRPGAAQSTVMLGLPVAGPATPGFMRLSVANALFGGSLLSRLDQDLREDKGWTYGAASRITPYAGSAAVWTLATDVNAPDTAPALAEIFKELERLRSTPPSAEELKAIQNYRAGTFVIGASSRGGLIAQLAFCELQGLPADWLTNYVAHLYAVTPQDVRAAAAEYLDPGEMTLVVLGDLRTLKPAILALPALSGASIQ
ncbi:MAG TPA: pitrilysin family protein [Steroidobacteraceae bacterium]|nr:pitrilysin family protein [Steroidobacteraceae bacterium]